MVCVFRVSFPGYVDRVERQLPLTLVSAGLKEFEFFYGGPNETNNREV